MAELAKRRVLLIDDDPLIRHLVRASLQETYEVVEAGTGSEGLDLAEQHRPDLVLLDVMMPGMDGFEVCCRLRQNPKTANVPIVMLTALGNINEKVRGLQIGADDYVTKPFDMRELATRIAIHLRRSERDLGSNPLTSLPGNPIIQRVLQTRLDSRQPLAVLYIDMDHFKSYNDEYGWLKGDDVITLLSKDILEAVHELGGPDDFVGHIGGDDFIVITTPDRAESIAQRVIARFDAAILSYYPEDVIQRGYIEAFDRNQKPYRAPIASVAIAIVTNEGRELSHPAQVAAMAAEVKKYVKSLSGSQYAFDRRYK